MNWEKYYVVKVKNIITASVEITTEWFELTKNSKLRQNILKDSSGKKVGYVEKFLPYKENTVITKKLIDVLEYDKGIFNIIRITNRYHLLKKQILIQAHYRKEF